MDENGWRLEHPVEMSLDSQSAMAWITTNEPFSGRASQTDMKLYFLKDLVEASEIEVKYVASEAYEAGVLTKPLKEAKLDQIFRGVGVGAIEEEC